MALNARSRVLTGNRGNARLKAAFAGIVVSGSIPFAITDEWLVEALFQSSPRKLCGWVPGFISH